MKFNRILAALVFVGLAACSKKEKDPAPSFPEIPSDIIFDKGGLAPISDSEYQDASKTWQDLSSTVSLDNQLFTKDEDSETQTKREKQFAEMSAEQQQVITDWRANCQIDEQLVPSPEIDDPQAGDTFTESSTGTASGPNCPTLTTMNNNMLTTLLARDQGFKFEIGSRLSYGYNSQLKAQQDIQAMNYSSMIFSGTTDARARSAMGVISEMYSTSNLQGETVLADGTKILYNATVEALKKSDGRVHVIRVMFSRDSGPTYTFSHHVRYQNGFKVGEEKYFGNRQLSDIEISSLGKFPFPIEELAELE